MNIADWRIGARLALGFAGVLSLLFLLSGIGVWRLQAVGNLTDTMVNETLRQERLAKEWQSSTHVNGARTLELVASTDDARRKVLENQIKATSQRISEIQKQLDGTPKSPAQTALFSDIAERRSTYRQARDAVVEAQKAGNADGVKELVHTRLEPALDAYVGVIDKLATHQSELVAEASRSVVAQYRAGQLWIVALGGVALLFGIGFAYIMTTSITQPLNKAVKIAQTVAAGDLTSRIDARSKDETGLLLQALKDMNDSLVRIVGQVRSGTETIASASGQVAGGSLDLSSRTEQQASSLEETASSMEELTATVKQNADSARQANDLAASASQVAMEGGEIVSQVMDTMSAIDASSKKIVDIISVIDSIAFQTNILALNAAVEAARAGEQGRGFAVVAAEVRNLAQRSAGAAKEIKELINDSVDKVDSGGKLVGRAGATMTEIVASVQRVTGIIGEISAASHEQSSGIEQVNQAIAQMDEVTQQNAALVEEAAASADALQEQAIKLAQVVGVFKLDEAAPAAASVTPLGRRKAETSASGDHALLPVNRAQRREA